MRLEDPRASPERGPAPAVVEQPSELLPQAPPSRVTRPWRRGRGASGTLRIPIITAGWKSASLAPCAAAHRRRAVGAAPGAELDAPLAVELIFKAHRVDFTRPSREQILRDIGMTPDDVSDLLDHVDREQEEE